jgi:hypothetical protein
VKPHRAAGCLAPCRRQGKRPWSTAPSPRLRGEGRGEGAFPPGSDSRRAPLTLPRFARSTSPRKRGEVKAAPNAIALRKRGGRREAATPPQIDMV